MQTTDRVVVGPARSDAPTGNGDAGDYVWCPHPDKAISQRAALLAGLARGESRISGLADCRDTRANLGILAQLGIDSRRDGTGTVVVRGVDGAELDYRGADLDAGNSATTARLVTAVLAGTRSKCVVTGNSSLRARPMGWLVASLRALGADLEYLSQNGRLPVMISGRRLRGGTVEVTVDSAQAVSALLFGSILADAEVVIERRTAARDHTERLFRWAGIPVIENRDSIRIEPRRPAGFELSVPGDPSGAAVLAALHLASPCARTPLRLAHVCLNEKRLGFFRILADMGVPVSYKIRPAPGPEPVGDIIVGPDANLRGVAVAGSVLIQSAIDELPLIAALATQADRPTTVREAADLREKDTDRIAGMVALLRAFGADVQPYDDGLVVRPSRLRAPTSVRLPSDHRLVFAGFVLAALTGGRTELSGVAAANTSYPGFLADAARYLSLKRA